MPHHSLPSDQVLRELASDAERGLSRAEASTRLERDGPNSLRPPRRRPLWWRFLRQFHDPLLYALLITGAIKAFSGSLTEALVIWSVTLINAVIGFVQESRAETAIASLARVVRSTVVVLRDGRRQPLDAAGLVVGDVVLLEPGGRVPADLRLLELHEFSCDESSLTGESLPAAKQCAPLPPSTPLADRTNMAYAGSFVSRGTARAVVVAAGQDTELGRISSDLEQQVNLSTPLTRRFARFSRLLLKVVAVAALLTFLIGISRGQPWGEMGDAAVALAVSAIPEELPAIVTITLAIGVHRMARRNAIIRRLPAVEALGSATVICSDKTGTLTENRMTVVTVQAAGRADAPDREAELSSAQRRTLEAGVLCNDAAPMQEGEGPLGDPTETALLVAADRAGLERDGLLDRWPRRDSLPFEAARQCMATVHAPDRLLMKGSLEAILPRCNRQLAADGGSEPLHPQAQQQALSQLAERGQRVLAFAEGRLPPGATLTAGQLPDDLCFLGLQGMLDPPRAEVRRAVAACHSAGIAVKMITGDHLATAGAIARQVGLGQGDGLQAMGSRELEALAEADLPEAARATTVFARVAPGQKLSLVRALQAAGEIVAMTGDGVNDAPALRQADIGIAMGRGGTEVAREAADMLLTDDNFASIEAAVEEGRGVAMNLHKALAFVLPINGGESMTIVFSTLLGLPLPITALQILWLNMVNSLTLSVPLAFEPRAEGLMQQPPRRPDAPLLTGGLLRRLALVSAFNWAVIFGLFAWGQHQHGSLEVGRTMAVQGLVLSRLIYLLSLSEAVRGLWRGGHLHWPALRQAPCCWRAWWWLWRCRCSSASCRR
ncbi:HAD family hydrolase [Synechococcus sp. RSCCF101]|uniref:cation-translocating P-type ATPase n=1 Tax=Synechococcus sp. RSCCF101 TaxID=2511069 RepID=UPI0012468CC9|nr:HAD family hydrolase [Synechococcus sp. RSCCF101]